VTGPVDMTTDRETFYGPWDVTVLFTSLSDAPTGIFFEIAGSDSADGRHPGVPGQTVAVTGAEWALTVGSQAPGGPLLVGHLRRTATFDIERGLLVQIDGSVLSGFSVVGLTLELQSQDRAVDLHE